MFTHKQKRKEKLQLSKGMEILKKRIYNVCGEPCTLQSYVRAVDKVVSRCPIKRCRRTISIREGNY